jgi:hypothetical protein
MPIVSSVVIVDSHAQRSGSRYVVERHTDDAGRVYTVGPYLLSEGLTEADAQARANARAVQINEQLAESEVEALIDGA